MGLIAPAKYEYFHVNPSHRGQVLFRYWFSGLSIGSGQGADQDLRLGVGPSGRESTGILIAATVSVTGASSDYNFEIRCTPSAGATSGSQHEVYQKQSIDTWFKENNINVPYKTIALEPVSAFSAANLHNGRSKLWAYIINNTSTTITNVFIELLLNVDQAYGSGFGYWDPSVPQNEAWKPGPMPLRPTP